MYQHLGLEIHFFQNVYFYSTSSCSFVKHYQLALCIFLTKKYLVCKSHIRFCCDVFLSGSQHRFIWYWNSSGDLSEATSFGLCLQGKGTKDKRGALDHGGSSGRDHATLTHFESRAVFCLILGTVQTEIQKTGRVGNRIVSLDAGILYSPRINFNSRYANCC